MSKVFSVHRGDQVTVPEDPLSAETRKRIRRNRPRIREIMTEVCSHVIVDVETMEPQSAHDHPMVAAGAVTDGQIALWYNRLEGRFFPIVDDRPDQWRLVRLDMGGYGQWMLVADVDPEQVGWRPEKVRVGSRAYIGGDEEPEFFFTEEEAIERVEQKHGIDPDNITVEYQ